MFNNLWYNAPVAGTFPDDETDKHARASVTAGSRVWLASLWQLSRLPRVITTKIVYIIIQVKTKSLKFKGGIGCVFSSQEKPPWSFSGLLPVPRTSHPWTAWSSSHGPGYPGRPAGRGYPGPWS